MSIDFRQVVEDADIAVCIAQDERLAYVNPRFAQLHGWSAEALTGGALAQVLHPDTLSRVTEVRRVWGGGRRSAVAAQNLHRDGRVFETRADARPITYRGHPALLITLSDLSALHDAQRASSWRAHLLASNELLCRSGSVEIVGPQAGVWLSAGARALVQSGGGEGPSPLRAALRHLHPDDRARVISHWRRALPGRPFEFRHRLKRADGSVLRVLHRGLIETVDGESRPKPIAILQDITEQSAAQDQIERLVNYHPVTGLATRSLLLKRAAAAVELAQRENRPVAMLFLRVADVDRVHDALGLSAGDALATTLAARLLNGCRSEDTAAHVGSGEFMILLDPTAGADESQALNTATRLLATLAAPAAVDEAELVTDGQIGIAMFPSDSADAGELLAHAHAACGRGGAGISFFTREAGESAARRIKLEGALRRAFERAEFELHYQPQVDLRSGRICGVEALLRWRSEEFGAVSPAEFVPIAEEIGLIVPLGEWVFRTACQQSVQWQRAGLPPVRIGVNLSPRQLEVTGISERLQSILLDTGADPNLLGVEVTESVLMRDFDHARRTLEELSALGIEIALDDFGTGYSNLGALRALPFDVLKIDRSLVHDVTAAPEDVSMTRAVLMLAHGLKLKVLAEGVETEGQLKLLISNGCELMQGYIFSKPVPAAQLERMLRGSLRLPNHMLRRTDRTRTLLLVDDEDSVLAALKRMLRGAGYRIVTAASGEEALARLTEHEVDVIVSDQGMPGMSGVELMRRATALYPDTVRIVLSGYGELQAIGEAVNEGAIHKFLTKPWDDERLRAHIAEAFRRKELADENRRLSMEVRGANLELARANQRQAEMLAEQREQLSLEEVRALNAQDLLEQLPTAILGIDAQGTIAFVNRRARALLRSAPALVGFEAARVLPPEWLGALHQPDGTPHAGSIDGRPCLLACEAMQDRGRPRGHLLSIIPTPGCPAPERHPEMAA